MRGHSKKEFHTKAQRYEDTKKEEESVNHPDLAAMFTFGAQSAPFLSYFLRVFETLRLGVKIFQLFTHPIMSPVARRVWRR